MLYPNLKFKKPAGRPLFYTNFVSTLDGKVAVKKPGYWPIGSRKDYEVLLELRGYADALIHGKTTASSFPTVRSLALARHSLLYIVVSASPDAKLLGNLRNSAGIRPLLVTTRESRLPRGAAEVMDVVRLGKKEVNLLDLSAHLAARGIRRVLVEGGPTLMGSFFKYDLVDEMFLTLAPKVFGNETAKTMTMTEGALLSPKEVRAFKLLSAREAGDEVFLRYRRIR